MSDLYAQPGHLLWRASARVDRFVDEILPGTTDIHAYAALLGLADQEPQSQQSLARMVAVSGTTMTSVVEKLLGDGLVARVRNPADRRSYSLTRTPAGRSAVRQWAPNVARLEQRLTSSLGGQGAARLREILRHVAAGQIDQRTPAELRESTGFLLTRAHLRAHREFLGALQPLDIEPRHYGTMRVLRLVRPLTQGQLAALLDVSPATVVQIVDHLEQRGLLTRQRDSADRRVYLLHLTEDGKRVLEQVTEIAARLHESWLGGPGSRACRDLVRLLTLLLTDAAVA